MTVNGLRNKNSRTYTQLLYCIVTMIFSISYRNNHDTHGGDQQNRMQLPRLIIAIYQWYATGATRSDLERNENRQKFDTQHTLTDKSCRCGVLNITDDTFVFFSLQQRHSFNRKFSLQNTCYLNRHALLPRFAFYLV